MVALFWGNPMIQMPFSHVLIYVLISPLRSSPISFARSFADIPVSDIFCLNPSNSLTSVEVRGEKMQDRQPGTWADACCLVKGFAEIVGSVNFLISSCLCLIDLYISSNDLPKIPMRSVILSLLPNELNIVLQFASCLRTCYVIIKLL